ncbi:uncharacterized protein isoform X2 [Rhodnius prolixus]|uniref:Uncharacterized protein n=1 Tax=Rhodnius prolixus TaxID=13249 RepID=T1HMF6_RHOPR
MNDQKLQNLFLDLPYEELDTEAGLPNFRNQPVLIKSLRQRKIHNPLGTFDAPVFNSYHLLDAFSIYSRPNDFPSLEKGLEDIEEKDKLPFLVEPGETFLHNSKIYWFPWETDVDKRRENLKYADVVGGVPQELSVGFEQSLPEIKGEDVIPTVTVNKKIQTEKLPALSTLKSDDEEMEDTEKEKQTEATSDNDSNDLTKKDDIVDNESDRKSETSSSHALATTFSEPNGEQPQVKKLKMRKVHKRRYK